MASVQQHKSRWRVKWHVDGQALYESYATKREAEDAARRIEARTVLDGLPPMAVDADTLTFARWWDRWEPGRAWRQTSRDTHASHYRTYIKPVFGNVAITAITSADVRKFHRVLERRGLAPRTVGAVHRTLSMALQGALEDEVIGRNPASTARLRTPVQSPPVALDASTTAAMLDAIAATTPALATFARFVNATGLRRSEAAGLTWDRIDLDAGVVVVDRQMDYTAKVLPAWSPTKTSSTRRVLLTDKMVAELRAHRASQVTVIGGSGLVFTRDDGTPWHRTSLANAWTRAANVMADAGTPLPAGARGWHTLRHGTASRLLEAGVPVAEAAAMLGHSPEMLLSTYAHVVDRSAADERLRAALDL